MEKRRSPWIAIILAVIIGLMVIVLLNGYIRPTSVVVAKVALAPGTRLTSDLLELRTIPMQARPRDAFERIEDVQDQVLAVGRAPGDPIVGYITLGRGVTIHRSDCRNVLKLPPEKRIRLVEVAWGTQARKTYPVDIEILAFDRQGLLRDITAVLSNEQVNVIGVNTTTDKNEHSAHMSLTVEVGNIDELARVLGRISQLPNVTEAHRRV